MRLERFDYFERKSNDSFYYLEYYFQGKTHNPERQKYKPEKSEEKQKKKGNRPGDGKKDKPEDDGKYSFHDYDLSKIKPVM